jgi:hypothetical protein
MSRPYETLAGRSYTHTAALLLGATFCPITVLATSPYSGGAVSMTLLVSALCLALAWVRWHRYSAVTVPSLNLR